MKSMKHILTACCVALLMASCSYLDQKPYEYWQPEDVFIDYDKTVQLLNSMYSAMPNGYANNFTNGFLGAATDDGAFVNPTDPISKLAQGYVTELNPIENQWSYLYIGIRRTLYFEQYIDLLQNVAGWTDENVAIYKKRAVAESKTVRALYYFELIKRYGGVPLVKKTYSLDDNEITKIPRNTFEECVAYITQLCDEAMEIYKETGDLEKRQPWRVYGSLSNGPCAMAIKAKTLAYAASPLYNNASDPLLGYTDNNVQERWKAAAKALKRVIDLPEYKLYPNYEKLFIVKPSENTEYIVYTGNLKSYMLERYQYPPSLLGTGGTCPTQNLVNAFEKADGSQNEMNSANRYEKMDPRFYSTILYDGATMGPRGTIDISSENSQDAIGKVNLVSTVTGYYLRKFLDTNIDLSAQSITTTYHYFPVIRLADIYLLYAEAMNEAYGPDNMADLGMTALQALNKVRGRAGITTLQTASKEELKNKIINERRVELAFEDQRYFDLRRWKLADTYLNRPVTGFEIKRNDDEIIHATEFTVDAKRRFYSKMYYAPIPYSEMHLNHNLKQNPGWR